MKFTFLPDTPETHLKPILISGEASRNLWNVTYIKYEEEEEIKAVFEIRYDCHCSPFSQVMIEQGVLAVGYEECFYLFSLSENKSLLILELHGYFGHLYHHENCFYVADSGGLYRIDEAGAILWHNSNLGIDGVIINDFTDNTITGQGEWDPPGGWRDFVLDKQTGMLIKDNA